eukprot:m.84653 g.84653  ORF g.84653 m.84653 type:complete len:434 (+) comp21206_c0_seq2:60-1361(+)
MSDSHIRTPLQESQVGNVAAAPISKNTNQSLAVEFMNTENSSDPKDTSNPGSQEEFFEPSKVIPEEAPVQKAGGVTFDLNVLDRVNTQSNRSALTRDSLYVKFDPLCGSPAPKSATDSLTNANTAANTQTAPIESLPSSNTTNMAEPQDTQSIETPADSPPSPSLNAISTPPTTQAETPKASSRAPLTDDEYNDNVVLRQRLEEVEGFLNNAKLENKELKVKVDKMEQSAKEMAQAQQEQDIMQMEIDDLRAKLAAANDKSVEMTTVVEEYQQAMSKMIETTESDKHGSSEELTKLKRELEQTTEDLNKTETAFSDLHRKYEKAKEIIENLKKNETALKNTLDKAQETLKISNEKYKKLKSHAEGKIETANSEIANVRDNYKNQIGLLNVKIKKAETNIAQLTRQLEAKEKDNEELNAICNDLMQQLEATTGQ